MTRMIALAASATLLFTAGCATQQTGPVRQGAVANTVDRVLPPGVSAAHIFEIDGEPVAYTKRVHKLTAGPHTVRVSPVYSGPQYLINVPHHVKRTGPGTELAIDVEPGRTYFLGAVVHERNYAQNGYKGRWEPVVVKIAD